MKVKSNNNPVMSPCVRLIARENSVAFSRREASKPNNANVDADPAFRRLYRMGVACVADVSEEHTASIVRAEVRCVM
jgi:hypothetical protein